jgi:thiol-disulfide isomerase/thioredoxin
VKRINVIVLFGAILFANTNSFGQTKKISYIRKGQTVPNFPLQIFNGKTSQNTHLYDIKKKLILLDIWGIDCTTCIKAMPHLLELQQNLKDDVQIVLVTKNTKEQVDGLWRKLKGHAPKTIIDAYQQLQSVLNDTMITRTIPVDGLPTQAWIDTAHMLRAITNSTTTNLENMQAFITGGKVHLDEQGTKKMDIANPLSWLDKDTGFLDRIQSYSFIFSRVNHSGIGHRTVVAKTDSISGKIVSFSCVNVPLTDLYKLAYFKYNPRAYVPDYKILLNIRDKDKFRWEMDYSKFYDWADTSLYCFAVKVMPTEADCIYKMMQGLLDNYFHYQSQMERRRVRCLALKRISTGDKLKTTAQNTMYEYSVNTKGSFLVLKNQPMELLFSRLESLLYLHDPFMPFFDETNYRQNIDITLPWSDNLDEVSYDEVRKTLNKYGLDLVEEYKDLEMLVITDSN